MTRQSRNALFATTILASFAFAGAAQADPKGPSISPRSFGNISSIRPDFSLRGSNALRNVDTGNLRGIIAPPESNEDAKKKKRESNKSSTKKKNVAKKATGAVKGASVSSPPTAPILGVNLGSPAGKKIEALQDKLGIESLDAVQGVAKLPSAFGTPDKENVPGLPGARREPGGAGPAMTLDDPQEKAADAYDRLQTRRTHSDGARDLLHLLGAPRDAEHHSHYDPGTADRPPSTTVETSWTAGGETHLVRETLVVRRRSHIVSDGYYYSHSRGPDGRPETIYFNGNNKEVNRITRHSQTDATPARASIDGGRTWEPYQDNDHDGRHDRQSEASYQPANAPSGGGTTDSSGNTASGTDSSGNTVASTTPSGSSGGGSTSGSGNSNQSTASKPDSSSSGDKPDSGGQSSSGDKPGSAEKTDKPDKKSQPVEGGRDTRDYFGERGVTHPGGRPKQQARGSDDRNIPDPSGVIIVPDGSRTPEERKTMTGNWCDGVECAAPGGGGKGSSGRRVSDFAQPPVGTEPGEISPANPNLPGVTLLGGGGTAPSIPNPGDPDPAAQK